jgi:hypothetical protein
MNYLTNRGKTVGKIAIVSVWLVMILTLFLESNHGSLQRPPVAGYPQTRANNQWFGVYFHNEKIGFLHRTLETAGNDIILEEVGQLRLKLGNSLQRVHLATKAWTSENSELKRFEFSLKSDVVQLHVEGAVHPDHLHIKVRNNDQVSEEDIPLSRPVHLPSSVGGFLIRNDPQPGQRFKFALFDPATLSQENLEVEVESIERMKVGNETQSVLRARGLYKGMTVYSWIGEDGRTLREESPGGMVLLTQPEREAVAFRETDLLPDLLSLSAAPSSQNIPDPRSIQQMTYQLEGWGNPSSEGRVHYNTTPGEAQRQSYRLPHPMEPPLSDYLVSERFVESQHPKIIAITKEVLEGEKDADRVVKKLAKWVHDSLEKRYTVSIPNAVTVLELKEGDCNEHTVLFTAMARAAGVPTRMVAGVVYLNDRFYYHAWPEVWLGQWVAVDPTFDQFPADATHIRLVIGGLDQQTRLVEAIGRLKIKVVSFQ